MKLRFALAAFLFSLGAAAFPQEKATTASGRTVILNSDGTWKYQDSPEPEKGAAQPTKEHLRLAAASAKLELTRNKCTLYFDAKKWKRTKDENGKYSFEHINGDGYGLVIAERVQMSAEALRGIALKNALEAAPDAKIVFEEKRRVNGRDVNCLQIKCTIESIPFRYYGYYYVGKEGTIQVLTYTAENLFIEYEKDFQDFLDGFTIDK